jgi:FlaA1/EpsC-like NDP-sugar epimerase
MSETKEASDFIRLVDELLSAQQIVLFGAGELAMFSMLRLAYLGVKLRVVAISDNNTSKIGMSIEGIPVIPVAELAANYRDAKVIITIGNIGHSKTSPGRAGGFIV